MELTVHRTKLGSKATEGTLEVDGTYECVTLEDVVRDLGPDGFGKVQDDTAIPAGRYKVIINMSPRLGRMMMRLVDVPYFTGILIHSGNTHVDTHGCLLVGSHVDNDDLIHGGSHSLPILQEKVQTALDAGDEVWITLCDEF